jgi:hypothetical protein
MKIFTIDKVFISTKCKKIDHQSFPDLQCTEKFPFISKYYFSKIEKSRKYSQFPKRKKKNMAFLKKM